MTDKITALTYIGNGDPAVIEGFYRQYLESPESLDSGWRKFFEGFEFARTTLDGLSAPAPERFSKEANVLNLIGAYRQRGHLFTKTNPVRTRRKYDGPLVLEAFNLGEKDLDTVFQAGNAVGLGPVTLREIVALLDQTYCHSVGVEYKYIRSPNEIEWLQAKMESCRNTQNFSTDEKMHILGMLTRTVVFEKFMHSRFVGQKRFSIEGVETIIPALDAIIEKGVSMGIEEFVLGSAHRGRLNILANILRKSYDQLFGEFEGKTGSLEEGFAGDVKYHLGFSSERLTTSGKRVQLSIAPNPSHLEAVDPVVEGIVRARLDRVYGGDLNKIAPILIHGDSSIAGQGVVYEVLQMSMLDGYKTGGTIHVVLNNQVGFTTNYLDARSSTYCTDVGKVTLSPVFHVNGDDVEAVVYVIGLALEFRQTFHRDVFIDILGYRKHGHNEGDEPRFTQPVLYKAIAKHPNPLEIYARKLTELGTLDAVQSKKMQEKFEQELQEHFDAAKQIPIAPDQTFMHDTWKDLIPSDKSDFASSPETGVDLQTLRSLSRTLYELPSEPKFFSKIVKILQDRKRTVEETNKLDWAMGELLAYGSLVNEGFPVRVSGQDSERGTFSHRHAVLKIEDSEEEYVPLEHVSPEQARFSIYNSPLSEYGVLGFEYGYASATPNGLTVWEAQFGDFGNGAQIIFDQFLSAAESKWKEMNGLCLLLPHGYEGQGPEHSSARLERALALCADNNMQVVNCTTPANLFHTLRRQLHRPFRKPLIVMTPKSLLRHPLCTSPLEDFASGTRFQEVMDDSFVTAREVTKVLLCSGKLYYDLLDKQQKEQRKNVAVIRLEQLYPLPHEQLAKLTGEYKSAKQWTWVQEEPENMGAWSFMLRKFTLAPLTGIFRKESGVTATGYVEQHHLEQKQIVELAFV